MAMGTISPCLLLSKVAPPRRGFLILGTLMKAGDELEEELGKPQNIDAMMTRMLTSRSLLPIGRMILKDEQKSLPRECVVRLAARPPFYRCSCGSRYNNTGEHSAPQTPLQAPWWTQA